MSGRPTRVDRRTAPLGCAEVAAERAYELVEEGRLRCEQLIADAPSPPERTCLGAMHRQLGMAGWVASSHFDAVRRQTLLARARRRSLRPMPYRTAAHGLAEVVVDAEDALAEGLIGEEELEHLHAAHLHLLHAMDLLHRHLFPPTVSDR
jgi:hypothetical protein